MSSVVAYNGTTGKADDGHSTGVSDLNIFYDVRPLLYLGGIGGGKANKTNQLN